MLTATSPPWCEQRFDRFPAMDHDSTTSSTGLSRPPSASLPDGGSPDVDLAGFDTVRMVWQSLSAAVEPSVSIDLFPMVTFELGDAVGCQLPEDYRNRHFSWFFSCPGFSASKPSIMIVS